MVQLALEWELHVLQTMESGLEELDLLPRHEILAGPRRQTEQLAAISEQLKADPAAPEALASPALLASLRDAYSLDPSNKAMLPVFTSLLAGSSQEASGVQELYADLQSCLHLFVHISCHSRIDLALADMDTFKPYSHREMHLIVVGEQGSSGTEVSLSCRYRRPVLQLSCPDDYAGLAIKVMLAYTIISLLGFTGWCYKMDDDVCLNDRSSLARLTGGCRKADLQYGGSVVSEVERGKLWHGWHLGKCTDPSLEQRGLQIPLPKSYAIGGHPYCLGARARAHLADFFLSAPVFFQIPCWLPEDLVVGLALEAAGLPPARLQLMASPSQPRAPFVERGFAVTADTMEELMQTKNTQWKVYLTRTQSLRDQLLELAQAQFRSGTSER